MSNNKPIRRIAIIGTGVIGASWTALFLAKGLDVIATDIAPDAETALEKMAEAAADVVMCDVEMPGQGGLWLAAQLGERFPATAIVLATAVDSVPPKNSMKPSIRPMAAQ